MKFNLPVLKGNKRRYKTHINFFIIILIHKKLRQFVTKLYVSFSLFIPFLFLETGIRLLGCTQHVQAVRSPLEANGRQSEHVQSTTIRKNPFLVASQGCVCLLILKFCYRPHNNQNCFSFNKIQFETSLVILNFTSFFGTVQLLMLSRDKRLK